jgi:hypothetical protein
VKGVLREAIQRPSQVSKPEGGIDQFVPYWANQLRGKPGYEEVVQGLDRLSGDAARLLDDLEETEKALSDLDARMMAIARNSPERKSLESRIASDPQLLNFKVLLTKDRYQAMKDQCLVQKLREVLGLPHLSLSGIDGR